MGSQPRVTAYRHLVWDWNGTLMDDVQLCLEITNLLLARRALPPMDTVRYRDVFGFPLRDYCQRIGFDLCRDSYEAISDEFAEIYEQRRYECPLQKGAAALLAERARLGVDHSLLSAYGQERLEEIVHFYGLDSFFSAVVGLDNDYGEGKVERGRRRMEEMSWDAAAVLYVGDTLHDAEVARAMGVDCLLIAHGHQSRVRLQDAGYPVVDDLGAVEPFLAGNFDPRS